MKRQNPRREPPEVVAIIPARGGRQSIPGKNLLKLAGKPLLVWAIDVAFAARAIDLVLVSTEDARIARVARDHGAFVAPRPVEYSQPDSDDAGFYRHAVRWLEREYGWTPELWVNLRPTGPLRAAEDVDACVRHVRRTGCDGLKSVIPSPIPPYKMWTMKKDGALKPLVDHPYRRRHGPDIPRQRAQRLFPAYWQDANIDVTRRGFIMSGAAKRYGNCFGPNIHGYVMDERKIVDIDTPADLRNAERVLEALTRETRSRSGSGKRTARRQPRRTRS